MDSNNPATARKGGRPQKAVKRNQLLAVKCTRLERAVIEHRAKAAAQSTSEFLRTLALGPRGEPKKQKVLPREVLLLTGTLNHLAANLNQIAFRCNRGDVLMTLERGALIALVSEVKQLALDIKTYLK